MGLLGIFFCARPTVNRQSGDRRRGVRGSAAKLSFALKSAPQ